MSFGEVGTKRAESVAGRSLSRRPLWSASGGMLCCVVVERADFNLESLFLFRSPLASQLAGWLNSFALAQFCNS